MIIINDNRRFGGRWSVNPRGRSVVAAGRQTSIFVRSYYGNVQVWEDIDKLKSYF